MTNVLTEFFNHQMSDWLIYSPTDQLFYYLAVLTDLLTESFLRGNTSYLIVENIFDTSEPEGFLRSLPDAAK
jgi:hypothetical protein